ncbi:MAG TPA: triphosphoribosyl-dephospho-CoA synthase MdcB [Casimicrobiaceae bacterium]|nr:triphosphoribosyl-dephospho-CoA synthase MdcB [Casimicrobiaceae bacterium]
MNPASHAHDGVAFGFDARRLGSRAIASLYAELACAPKPGLVTLYDCGSHRDMNATTFMRSLNALRPYFTSIASAGAAGAPFAYLRELGIEAEIAMLEATGGINTHRGAIFSLGLLVAAAGALAAEGHASLCAKAVCETVRLRWQNAIRAAPLNASSHGQCVARKHQAGGARAEASAGFPSVRKIALPQLREALRCGVNSAAATTQALMALIASTEDTNLLHRGSDGGLRFAQQRAHAFLRQGGVMSRDWRPRLERIGREFVAHDLSPGGSADLVACAWFLHDLERRNLWR